MSIELYRSQDGERVDSMAARQHGEAMAKPRKVEEPAGSYSSPTPSSKTKRSKVASAVNDPVRRIDDKTFQKAADKVFKTHAELFRRLAQ